jgi:hypothetical protein
MAFIGLPWPIHRTGWRPDDPVVGEDGVGDDDDIGTSGAASPGRHPVAATATLLRRKVRRDRRMLPGNQEADCSQLRSGTDQ